MNLSELLQERQVRRKHEESYVPGNLPGWDQLKIHKSESPILIIFGGNQSGKSHSAAMETMWRLTNKHPHKSTTPAPILAWCVSASYSTIRSGIYRHLLNCIPKWEIQSLGPRVQGHDLHSYIQLKNGSRVEFYSAKGYDDAREKLQAAKVDVINIDEEIPEVVYKELMVRQLAAESPVIIISATMVNSEPYMVALEERALANDPHVCMTRLDTSQNPNVNQEVLNEVLTQLDDEDIQIRIKGLSNRLRGLVYRDFSQQNHIIKPFPIPRNWTRYCGIDPGLRTFAILWLAVSPDNKLIIYDEVYEHGAMLYEIVDIIRMREGWVRSGVMPAHNAAGYITKWNPGPAYLPMFERVIDDKRGSRLVGGEWGMLEQLNLTYGIQCTPAIKNKRIGIERVRQALKPPEPELQVFNTCTNFIKEIQNYRYKQDRTRANQHETQQDPIKKNDHLLDTIRYMLMSDPQYVPIDIAVFEEVLDTKPSDDFSIHEYRKRKIRERESKSRHAFVGDGVGGA